MAQHTDATLIQLFHSLPFEIREKIQRFTYKVQSKSLLEEIRERGEVIEYLQKFTILMDTANSAHGFSETTEGIHERLWTGLDLIRNKCNKYRCNKCNKYKCKFINKWKYYSELQSAEETHKNGEKYYERIPWEQSFSVYFWMCFYH